MECYGEGMFGNDVASGTITDPSGAFVSGVSVTIVRRDTGLKRTALTDTAGEYRSPACQLETTLFPWRKQDVNSLRRSK